MKCIHKTSIQKNTHFLTEHYCINFWSSASSSDATFCTSWYNRLLVVLYFIFIKNLLFLLQSVSCTAHPKYNTHSVATSNDFVAKIFLKVLLRTYSKDLIWDLISGSVWIKTKLVLKRSTVVTSPAFQTFYKPRVIGERFKKIFLWSVNRFDDVNKLLNRQIRQCVYSRNVDARVCSRRKFTICQSGLCTEKLENSKVVDGVLMIWGIWEHRHVEHYLADGGPACA